MKNKKIAEYNQALRYCYLLLKYRKRGEQELLKRLRLRQCPEPIREKVIASLRESGLITEDRDFAAEWAEYKLAGGYGINRIGMDLMRRGIKRETIDQLRVQFRKEKKAQILQAIRELVSRKTKGRPIDYSGRQKLIRFLLSRGFSSDEVIEVIDEIQ